MIYLFEQALRSSVTSLGYVEKYGGIVWPVFKEDQVGDGQYKKSYYPVSRYANVSNCFDNGTYQHLIPDQSFYSVAYWEERGGGRYGVKVDRPKSLFWNTEHEMRLVCWLNLQKLGWSDYADIDNAQNYLIKQVQANHGAIITNGVYKFRLSIVDFSPVERDHTIVFRDYNYADPDHQWAFGWPYGFFAVDFTVKSELDTGCITEPSLGSEITCVQTW